MHDEDAGDQEITVKLISLEPQRIWRRQLPGAEMRWGRCRFLLDPEARTYDWLVVCNDLPDQSEEILACSPARTILTTTEPATIKIYGRSFTRQFAFVLTSQDARALPHPGRIFAQPALRWFYGVGAQGEICFDEMMRAGPPAKSKDLSMVWSAKQQRHTLHHRRFTFMQRLRERMSEAELYGRGVRPLDDKAEALDAYRYHIAIENEVSPHHWTEKLSDPFLAGTLPFYSGCPNAEEYFPPESFIRIDVRDPDDAVRIIRAAIAEDAYTKRFPAILEARRRVLTEYNFFAVIARLIEERHALAATDARSTRQSAVIRSRRRLRRRPLIAIEHFIEKAAQRLRAPIG